MGSQERIIPYMPEFKDQTPPSVVPTDTRRGFLGKVASFLGVAASGTVAHELFKPQPASADTSTLQVLPPSAINIEKDPNRIAEITRNLITKINQMFPDAESRVNATGFRISNGWLGADENKYLATQRLIFQEQRDEKLYLWNTLDNMSEYGLDPKLDSGELGVTIPPMQKFNDRSATLEGIFAERIATLKVPDEVVNFIKEIRKVAETGVFTGYKDYGPYEVWRYQRGAVQKWNDGADKGLIQGILAGDAAAAAGLIPKDVLLDKPDLGSGGGPEVTPKVELQRIALIETSSGGSVEFLQDPHSPMKLRINDVAEVKRVAERYAASQKIQIIIAPSTDNYEGVVVNNSFGNWVQYNGQPAEFRIMSGIDWDSQPGRIVIAPFSGTIDGNQYNSVDYLTTDFGSNAEITRIASMYTLSRINALGRRNPGATMPPDIVSAANRPVIELARI